MPVYDPDTRAVLTVPEANAVAFKEVNPEPAPVTVVKVAVLAVKLPLASLATIVEAPLAEAAVVLSLDKVPVVMAVALRAVSAEPLAVMTLATKLPEASRATIVEAPLAEAAVVLALFKVPEETEVALRAVRAEPLAVITFAEKLPEASRATIVEAPLAEAAVVLSLATVPVVIAVPLSVVIEAPEPVNVVAVIPAAAKLPEASRATMVLAPFVADAVVRALIKVPLVMFDALVVSVVAEAAKPDTLDAVIAMPTLEALVI
jgi:hypothetical protein